LWAVIAAVDNRLIILTVIPRFVLFDGCLECSLVLPACRCHPHSLPEVSVRTVAAAAASNAASNAALAVLAAVDHFALYSPSFRLSRAVLSAFACVHGFCCPRLRVPRRCWTCTARCRQCCPRSPRPRRPIRRASRAGSGARRRAPRPTGQGDLPPRCVGPAGIKDTYEYMMYMYVHAIGERAAAVCHERTCSQPVRWAFALPSNPTQL